MSDQFIPIVQRDNIRMEVQYGDHSALIELPRDATSQQMLAAGELLVNIAREWTVR